MKNKGDNALMLLVAVAAALVAIGTALGSTRPLIGLLIVVGAVVLLVYALIAMARQQTRKRGAQTLRWSDAWLLAVVFGMMLAGGGAALSVVHAPMVGLGIALGGGVLCGVGGWRMASRQH